MLEPGTFVFYNREGTSIAYGTLCMVLAYKGKVPLVQILAGKYRGTILYMPESFLSEHM